MEMWTSIGILYMSVITKYKVRYSLYTENLPDFWPVKIICIENIKIWQRYDFFPHIQCIEYIYILKILTLLTLKFHLLEQMVGVDNENYLIDCKSWCLHIWFCRYSFIYGETVNFLTGITYIVLTEITFIKI